MIAYDVIKELREERNWSQEQMAERLGMSKMAMLKLSAVKACPVWSGLMKLLRCLS